MNEKAGRGERKNRETERGKEGERDGRERKRKKWRGRERSKENQTCKNYRILKFPCIEYKTSMFIM